MTHLAGNDGSEHGDNKHGPKHWGGNAGVECGRVGVRIDHEECCLAQVSDDQRRVRHTQEAQLRSATYALSVDFFHELGKKLSCAALSAGLFYKLGKRCVQGAG